MNNVIVKDEVKIEDLIYEIRGVQVMLDSDLARLYQVETKRINEAVKNNPEKFPERFSCILTNEEEKNLRSKISTSSQKNKYGGRRYNTRVFTEQGVAMLSTILKSKPAVEVSIRIMDAFVKMRHFIKDSLIEQKYINDMVLEHDNSIKLLQQAFNKIEEKRKVNEIYFDGQIYDAYFKIQDIFKSATKKLIIIDAYADNTILDIIKRLDIEVIIITKKDNLLTKQDIEKYNKQYHNLKVIFNNSFHDRYFLIDNETVYHCGSSINRIGYKTFSINLVSDKEVCEMLIDKVSKII
ncbi:MAG: ORF6N domain-containing protein [Bacilli bacterium]|nr:ORF6N domain-containing protein [Bacilli bacterium]